jgi:hypothetical protein
MCALRGVTGHHRSLNAHCANSGQRSCPGQADHFQAAPALTQAASQSRRCRVIASGLARTQQRRRQACMRRERCPDTEEVTGSNPVSPTSIPLTRRHYGSSDPRPLTTKLVRRRQSSRCQGEARPGFSGRIGRPRTHRRGPPAGLGFAALTC